MKSSSNIQFESFLDDLKTDNNTILIESVKTGYKLLFESFENRDVVIVDIQPSYQDYFKFKIYELTDYLNEHHSSANKILWLYNGEDLGMESSSDIEAWLLENGLDGDVLDSITFFEKNYAFFRNAMDNGIDHSSIAKLIKYMMDYDITDSRDLDEATWKIFIENNEDESEIVEFLKDNEDMINVPDLMDELKSITNPIVMGGGQNECLAEVLIALNVLNINYDILNKFVY